MKSQKRFHPLSLLLCCGFFLLPLVRGEGSWAKAQGTSSGDWAIALHSLSAAVRVLADEAEAASTAGTALGEWVVCELLPPDDPEEKEPSLEDQLFEQIELIKQEWDERGLAPGQAEELEQLARAFAQREKERRAQEKALVEQISALEQALEQLSGKTENLAARVPSLAERAARIAP